MSKFREFILENKKYISYLFMMTFIYASYLAWLSIFNGDDFLTFFTQRLSRFFGSLTLFFFMRLFGLIFILFFKIKNRFLLIVDSVFSLYIAIVLYIGLYLGGGTVIPTLDDFGNCMVVGTIALLGALGPPVIPFGLGHPFVFFNYKLLRKVLDVETNEFFYFKNSKIFSTTGVLISSLSISNS